MRLARHVHDPAAFDSIASARMNCGHHLLAVVLFLYMPVRSCLILSGIAGNYCSVRLCVVMKFLWNIRMDRVIMNVNDFLIIYVYMIMCLGVASHSVIEVLIVEYFCLGLINLWNVYD